MGQAYQQIVLLTIAVGSFNYGFSFASASAVLGFEGFLNYFDINLAIDDKSYASSMQGAVVGVFFAGGVFGSFLFAWLADKIGRKRALDVVNLVSILGTILSAASVKIGMFLAGRVIQGIAGGGLNVICPMFQSEVSLAAHRGRNVGLHGFLFCCGLSACNWLATGLFFINNGNLQWRLVLGLQGAPPIILLCLRFWLPESPRWLVLHGRDSEALSNLIKLHDSPEDTTHERAKDEALLIRKQVDLDAQHDTSWLALFSRPSTRRRLFLGIFLMFLQQSTGQNVLYGFQINTLTTLGLTGWQPNLVVSFYVSWAATLNFVGGVLMDKLGRRTMILGALFGTITATSIHTALVITYGGSTDKAGAGAAVAFLFLFITFFAPGIDVTSYVYGAEIFPNYMRARGLAVTISAYFGFAAIYICTSSPASATIGAYYNIIFIVLSALNLVIGYFQLPETKGLSLEEMGVMFGEANEVAHIESGSNLADPMIDEKKGIETDVRPADSP